MSSPAIALLVIHLPALPSLQAHEPRVRRGGDEMRAEAVQARPEVFDEQQCGVAYGLLIPLLVLGEPLPVVVALELAQEIEQVGAEEGGVGHRLSSRLTT